jgi:flagellar hook-basal body complex protein FliE
MEIRSLIPVNSSLPAISTARPVSGTVRPEAAREFGEQLTRAVSQLNSQQLAVDDAATRLSLGSTADLHSIILEAEKANLTLELAIQIRNKALEAYQEIMRMPL